MKITYDTRNNCGKKRGCSVTIILPYGGKSRAPISRMYGIRNDIPKVLSLVDLSVDSQLEKERSLEKMAA